MYDDEELERGQRQDLIRRTQDFERCRWCGAGWHGLPRTYTDYPFRKTVRCNGSHLEVGSVEAVDDEPGPT